MVLAERTWDGKGQRLLPSKELMALGAGATAASSEAQHTRSLVNRGEGSSHR